MSKITMTKKTNSRELSKISAEANNRLYTNYEKEIKASDINKVTFPIYKAPTMYVNAFLKRKIDPNTGKPIDVGVISMQKVIFSAMAFDALELRKQGVEGTLQENAECEKILRAYCNEEVVKSGLGSGVKYKSINEYGKNMMLAEYSKCNNAIIAGEDIYANIKMMIFKTGDQQATMFKEMMFAIDFSSVTIKDILTMVMDVQHISRNVQETSIDMDKKVDLIITFTLGCILNNKLVSASTVLKNNVRRDENGKKVEVVTTNIKDIKANNASEFVVNINLGEEVVKDESVITSSSIAKGGMKALNEEFMGMYNNSYVLSIVDEACNMAHKHPEAANEIADLYSSLVSYEIYTRHQITNEYTTVQMSTDADKELVVQGIKNSIVSMQKTLRLNNRDFTLLVWGASCRAEITVGNITQKAFIASEERRYARDLFKEQILSLYSVANIDGTVDKAKEIISESIVVSPTIATAIRFEEDPTLSFEVKFEGNSIIDIATDKRIAMSPVLLDGKGYVEKVNGKIRAAKKIELSDNFELEGDIFVAPVNMVCLNNAMAVKHRKVRTNITEALEAQIDMDLKVIKKEFIGFPDLVLANGVHHDLEYSVITTNKKGELFENKTVGVYNALGYIDPVMQDVKAVATLGLGLVGKLSNIYDENAAELYAYGMTDRQGLLNALAKDTTGRRIDLIDIKYFEGKALALYKRVK